MLRRTPRGQLAAAASNAWPHRRIAEPFGWMPAAASPSHDREPRCALAAEISAAMGPWCRCDICQDVCPWNTTFDQPSVPILQRSVELLPI